MRLSGWQGHDPQGWQQVRPAGMQSLGGPPQDQAWGGGTGKQSKASQCPHCHAGWGHGTTIAETLTKPALAHLGKSTVKYMFLGDLQTKIRRGRLSSVNYHMALLCSPGVSVAAYQQPGYAVEFRLGTSPLPPFELSWLHPVCKTAVLVCHSNWAWADACRQDLITSLTAALLQCVPGRCILLRVFLLLSHVFGKGLLLKLPILNGWKAGADLGFPNGILSEREIWQQRTRKRWWECHLNGKAALQIEQMLGKMIEKNLGWDIFMSSSCLRSPYGPTHQCRIEMAPLPSSGLYQRVLVRPTERIPVGSVAVWPRSAPLTFPCSSVAQGTAHSAKLLQTKHLSISELTGVSHGGKFCFMRERESLLERQEGV